MKVKPKVTLLSPSQKALPLKFSGAGIGLKSVVYHMKLQALPSAGMPFPSIAPRLDFVFKGPYSLSDAFSFRKRCLICPRERKWLINDSCAFSDET